MHRLGHGLADLLGFDADIAAGDATGLLKLRYDRLDQVRRDGEADADGAAARREDRGVHANDLAVLGEQRATGVALVNRRVNLDELVVRTIADVATLSGDDARRDTTAKAERIAHGNHPLAGLDLFGI